jgi:glycerophosphoryl diester phosphodiesterase
MQPDIGRTRARGRRGSRDASPQSLLPKRGVCAHRGGPAEAPENTLAAFRRAAALGAHQIEFDVRSSADGALVVIHDETLDRTTDGRGPVRQRSLSELRRLDAAVGWHPRFRGEPIPTLAETLVVLPEDIWINVQIKRGEPIAEAVTRVVLDAGRRDQVVLACGNEAAASARRLDPEIRICNLARQRSRGQYVEHAIATGADFIQFHYLRGVMEPELAARAHAAGLFVNYFCAPFPELRDLHALFSAGVDFVLVDDVRAGLRVAGAAGVAPLPRAAE